MVDDSPFGTVVRPDDPREMVILYLRGNDSVDLASQLAELTRATVGIHEFLEAVERVHQSLLDLFKDRPPER